MVRIPSQIGQEEITTLIDYFNISMKNLFKFLPIYTRTVEETPNFHVKVNNKKILHVLVLSTVYNTYTLTIHLSYLNANKVNTKHFFATLHLSYYNLNFFAGNLKEKVPELAGFWLLRSHHQNTFFYFSFKRTSTLNTIL